MVALAQVLHQIGQTTASNRLEELARTAEALPVKLSETQAQTALSQVLHQIGQTTNAYLMRELARAIQALPVKLSETQAQEVLGPALARTLREINTRYDLVSLVEAVQALAPKLSQTQTQKILAQVLQKIAQKTDVYDLRLLAEAMEELPLGEAQAQAALAPVLKQIGKGSYIELEALARSVHALAPKLSETQIQVVLAQLLQQMAQRTNPHELRELARAMQGLPLSEAQAQAALAPVLRQIGQNDLVLESLAEAVQALAPKLSEMQVQAAFASVLKQIDQTTRRSALQALAGVMQALAPKLSETQVQAAFASVLKQIDRTTDSDVLRALARAVQALAPKLSETDLIAARPKVRSALAWSVQDNEAAAWAVAYVHLFPQSTPEMFVNVVVEALKYFPSADSATGNLLDALRNRVPGAPGSEQEVETAVRWLRQRYPSVDLQSRPVCPEPLPGAKAAGLDCPRQ
jgi:uncharacterized membrane-anchored protein YjiN (DUF445 family)